MMKTTLVRNYDQGEWGVYRLYHYDRAQDGHFGEFCWVRNMTDADSVLPAYRRLVMGGPLSTPHAPYDFISASGPNVFD